MRIFSYIIGFVFLLFSIVQLNDPDPLIWVIVYLIPASVAFLISHRTFSKTLLFVLAIAYLIIALVLLPPSFQEWIHAEEKAKSLGMTLPGIEKGREAAGLIICSLALAFFGFKTKK
jgi:hypothetical protein